MRNLLILGMLLVAAFMAGWFTIDRDGEQTTIKINRDEIRQDARQAIDRGKDYLDRQNVGSQETGQANALLNRVEKAASEFRYIQEGGQYGTPAGYQMQPNGAPAAPGQLQYSYPTAQQPPTTGAPNQFPAARY
ncbi:hypothetical protein EC9_23630 [Rosistilla ulvae]|uniref:Uncharacterized protein n=1 Tax=Rosistilla ulvae TaxID=1930277 RepID=A0A517LZY0_9BACT|nr:hypothetical protein [Rosistilla ulvae]QDS88175.1 hypothetical protein EC9_23630 [Rosistilla ulvae]